MAAIENEVRALKSIVASMMEVLLELSPQSKTRLMQKMRLLTGIHAKNGETETADLLHCLINDLESFGK